MKFRLNLDTERLQEKPRIFDGRLRNRLCNAASIAEITPEELGAAVEQGRSFTPAVLTGTTADTWQSQQVICADIDNDTGEKDEQGRHIMLANPLTPAGALRCMSSHKITPQLMYYSFSNKEEWPKFRIVLVLDEPITDRRTAADLSARFTAIFNEAAPHCADTTNKDAARLYYGGKPGCIIFKGTTTPVNVLQGLPAEQAQAEPQQAAEWRPEPKATRKGANMAELEAQFEADKMNFNLAEYIERTTSSRPIQRGRTLYFNPCPICGHNDDFQVTGALFHCFGASVDKGGTIIDYIMLRDKLDLGAAIDKVKFEVLGYDREAWRAAWRADAEADFWKPAENNRAERPQSDFKRGGNINTPLHEETPQNAPQEATESEEPQEDYSRYFMEGLQRLNEIESYLEGRGISMTTAARRLIGYDPIADPAKAPGAMGEEYRPHPCPRIIIPTDDPLNPRDRSHYTGRRLDDEKEYRYMNAGGKAPGIFNGKCIYAQDVQEIYVTEVAFDALSILEAGAEAIALMSANNANKLIKMFEKRRPEATFIICMDNDEAGRKSSAELREGLQRLNIPFTIADICGDYKDPNEALTADREAFIEAVKRETTIAIRPYNTRLYIDELMTEDIENFRQSKETGFNNLDERTGGLYAGLYVIAAASSVGKTTFALQLADQLAERGEDVLYFSLEQSRLEMVTKSLARRAARKDALNAPNSLQIRKGYLPPLVREAAKEYKEAVADRISIIEANFTSDISFIGNEIRQYIHATKKRPVVFVDYLQILQPEEEGGRRQTTKEVVDTTIQTLKQLSRNLNLTIFVISSVNRGNYMTPIAFESLKESGGIEYTADVVWGLQLNCLNDELFDNKDTKIKEKRAAIDKAKAEEPRKIELKCLKNRYGKATFSCYYDYYCGNDLFVDTGSKDPEAYTPRKAGKKL